MSSDTLQAYTFPTTEGIKARLAAVDPEPHTIESYHPLLAARLGGVTAPHPLAVVNAFVLAQADYVSAKGLPDFVLIQLGMSAHLLMEALIDDSAFLAATVRTWKAVSRG